MNYFITGASGFIGKRLVKALLARPGTTVHFLMRDPSEAKVAALRAFWNVDAARALPLRGDLTKAALGVSKADTKKLAGKIDGKLGKGTRAAVKELETRILVAEGKRSVERKVRTVKKVGKKAAKTGLIAGTLAAAAVVIHEAKKRR